MAKYTILETTSLRATRWAKRILDAVSTKDLENGVIGYVETLADGETHIYNFVEGLKEGMQPVIVNNPAYNPLALTQRDKADESQFINKAGKPFRVFQLTDLDEFAVTAEGFAEAERNTLATKKKYTVDSTGKFITATGTEGLVLELVRIRKDGYPTTVINNIAMGTTFYELKVVSILDK